MRRCHRGASGSPFIDGSGISVTIDGSGVLNLTTNSLIAISLAKALASNVPGVGYGPVPLRVEPSPRADD